MEGIRRPFIITQDIPAGGEIRVEIGHEPYDGIGLTVEHSLFQEEIGVRLSRESATSLRDALDTLLEEKMDRHGYAVLAM